MNLIKYTRHEDSGELCDIITFDLLPGDRHASLLRTVLKKIRNFNDEIELCVSGSTSIKLKVLTKLNENERTILEILLTDPIIFRKVDLIKINENFDFNSVTPPAGIRLSETFSDKKYLLHTSDIDIFKIMVKKEHKGNDIDYYIIYDTKDVFRLALNYLKHITKNVERPEEFIGSVSKIHELPSNIIKSIRDNGENVTLSDLLDVNTLYIGDSFYLNLADYGSFLYKEIGTKIGYEKYIIEIKKRLYIFMTTCEGDKLSGYRNFFEGKGLVVEYNNIVVNIPEKNINNEPLENGHRLVILESDTVKVNNPDIIMEEFANTVLP